MWPPWRRHRPTVTAPSPPPHHPTAGGSILGGGFEHSSLWGSDAKYWAVFCGLAVLLVVCLTLRGCRSDSHTPEFAKFRRTFLAVYLLMFMGDWMQASTTYALYDSYGFTRSQCGLLFLGGYVASMIAGPFVGAWSDTFGRKRSCAIYAVTHIVACLVKHSHDFHVILWGGACGGIGTAILWTSVEAWMVTEHRQRGFDEAWLPQTFSLMAMCNFLVAIPSGLLAYAAVRLTGGALVAPFDVAATSLFIGLLLCHFTWTENHGDTGAKGAHSVLHALGVVVRNKKVIVLEVLQALYEGSMYTFVFLWTPTMAQSGHPFPHGVVFSAFMVACGVGGCLFSLLASRFAVETFMGPVFLVAAGALAVPAITARPLPLMGAFCLFEVTVGLFWPALGSMRSAHIPDVGRATIIGLFRVPLNLLVCGVLVFQGHAPIPTVFSVCVVALGLCATLQLLLVRWAHEDRSPKLLPDPPTSSAPT